RVESAEEGRNRYADQIYDLPCVITTERPPFDLARRDPPVLANGYVTFGAFSRITKISDDAVAVWARILGAVPGSRLLMKDGAFDDASMREALRRRFACHGIAGDRIDFLGSGPPQQHLSAFP